MSDGYKFAVLGTPIEHSLSPNIHRIFAEGCGIKIEYDKIDTDKPELESTVRRLRERNYLGFNCTMPLKSDIVKLLNEKSEQVELLGVCNTVKVEGNILRGYMTDGDGMIQGIRYNGYDVTDKTVMVLGTSDTSKAVLLALVRSGAKRVIVLNRSVENLKAAENLFAGIFKGTGTHCDMSFQQLNTENLVKNAEESDVDVLINTTRLGMSGSDEHPDFSFIDRLKKDSVVVDAVYNPLRTRLLTEANNRGLGIVDGFWMLVYQGVLAFEKWTSLEVPDEYIDKAHGIIKRQR